MLLALLVCAWFDLLWVLSPESRLAAVVGSAVIGLVVASLLVIQTIRVARDAWAARRLDEAAGGEGVVLSGWELSVASDAHVGVEQPASRLLTRGLTQLAVARAIALARPSRCLKPFRPGLYADRCACSWESWRPWFCCRWPYPRWPHTQWKRFADPYADVPPYSPLQFQVHPGDVQVVYGSGLEIGVQVRGAPVDSLELVLGNGQAEPEVLPMFSEAEDRWRVALARITDPATYYVRADRARSHQYQIRVITVPRLESVKFRVTPPAYTNEPAYEGPLPDEGIVGLAGTQVRVWAKSNRPLSAGRLQLINDQQTRDVQLESTASHPAEVVGEFTIEQSGRFELSVVDAAGQPSQEQLGGSITRLSDQRPLVRLMQPKRSSLATNTIRLPVEILAEDDYGVSRVQLFRSLNHSRPLPVELPAERPAAKRRQDVTELPLATYGLTPGDEIRLFARVEDNDPSGSKGIESEVGTVRIISQAEFESMLRIQQGLEVLLSKYQQAQRRLEGLAHDLEQLQQRLAELPADAPASDALRDELRRLADQFRAEADALRQSSQHELPYDVDRNLNGQLTQLADRLQSAASDLEQTAAQSGLDGQLALQQVSDLSARLQASRQQFADQVQRPLDRLAQVYPLVEAAARFLILTQRQRDLAERLAAYQGSKDEDRPDQRTRIRELEEEQRRLRQELITWLDDFQNHTARLPDEPDFDRLRATASALEGAIRGSGAAESMSEAETALASFAAGRGYQKALDAAERLEKLLQPGTDLAGACQSCLEAQLALSLCLGNSLQQLLAEAGLGMGMGTGLGSGSGAGPGAGYSARRGTLDGVGLYGSSPALSGDAAGTMPRSGDAGAAVGGTASSDDAQPTPIPSAVQPTVGSGGAEQIPARYRQRVGQYFRHCRGDPRW